MHQDQTNRKVLFKQAITAFLNERLALKIEKLADDDPKRAELIQQFQPQVWIADAARRVGQIQLVTHSLKPIHPDARGTNIYIEPRQLSTGQPIIGHHLLTDSFADDVVGNAAALDVYKFLKLEVEGKSLLHWMLQHDQALQEALSDSPEQATAWREGFIAVTQAKSAQHSSHVFAKQLYWLTGHKAAEDDQYHMLLPLYASSLAHTVYQQINDDRFGEAGKLARQAKREQRDHDQPVRSYPNLAVQKLGGTKPQNISQLNSERRGDNYLLSAAPPHWKSLSVYAPHNIDTLFGNRLKKINDIPQLLKSLKNFLASDPEPNIYTRNYREHLLDALIGEIVNFAYTLQTGLDAGWSADTRCKLNRDERLWLDPGRAHSDEVFRQHWQQLDWPEQIGKRFANWLNAQLKPQLLVGDSEARYWKDELLSDEDPQGWRWYLDQQQRSLRQQLRNSRQISPTLTEEDA